MSRKLFHNSSDRLYISSYRKTNIRSLAEHCIHDINKLNMYIHKIVQLRLHIIKYNFICFLVYKQPFFFHISDISLLSTFLFLFIKYSFFTTSDDLFLSDSFFYFFFFHLGNVGGCTLYLYKQYCVFLVYYSFSISFYNFALFYKKGLASLPTKISKYTVLRSPHTDKTSREQFERRIYKKVYKFPSLLSAYYLFLCDRHYVYLLCTLVYESHTVCLE